MRRLLKCLGFGVRSRWGVCPDPNTYGVTSRALWALWLHDQRQLVITERA